MSAAKIKQYLTIKIEGMKKKGQIICEEEFEKVRDAYMTKYLYPSEKLDRIWGAEYLEEEIKNIRNSKNFLFQNI